MLSPVVFGYVVIGIAAITAGIALFAMWLEAKRKRAEEERLDRLIEEARRREAFEEELRCIEQIRNFSAKKTESRTNPYKKKSAAEAAGSPTNPYRSNDDPWPMDTTRPFNGEHMKYTP